MDIAAAQRLLREQIFCLLGTASADGAPWASPVFYNYDASLRLVWESARAAQHSQNIAANTRVAVAVSQLDRQESDEALYLECEAREVPPEGIDDALAVFLSGPHKKRSRREAEASEYGPEGTLGLYEAWPRRAYLLEVTHDESGRRLDRRVEAPLEDLRRGLL